MKPYVVVLKAKPATRLPLNQINLNFNYPNPDECMKIEITSIREKIAGVEVQVGLSFRVFLSSDSVSDAIESAKSFTDVESLVS